VIVAVNQCHHIADPGRTPTFLDNAPGLTKSSIFCAMLEA
jgi:hypothetical protein